MHIPCIPHIGLINILPGGHAKQSIGPGPAHFTQSTAQGEHTPDASLKVAAVVQGNKQAPNTSNPGGILPNPGGHIVHSNIPEPLHSTQLESHGKHPAVADL